MVPCPERSIFDKLVPQTAPVTVIEDEDVLGVSTSVVKLAVNVAVAFAFKDAVH